MLLVKISMVEWYDLVQKNLDVQKRENENKRKEKENKDYIM